MDDRYTPHQIIRGLMAVIGHRGSVIIVKTKRDMLTFYVPKWEEKHYETARDACVHAGYYAKLVHEVAVTRLLVHPHADVTPKPKKLKQAVLPLPGDKLKKKLLREAVEMFTRPTNMNPMRGSSRHLGIYSTANVAAGKEYRMSIPWAGGRGWTLGDFRKGMEFVKSETDAQKLVKHLETLYPVLVGHVRYGYHVGTGIYLNLRVDNEVLI